MSALSIEVEVDPEELWSSTFGSGFETWSWWRSVEFLDKADWDNPGKVRLKIADPDHEEFSGKVKQRTVDMDRLLWAVGQAAATCVDACTGEPITLRKGRVDFDACVGDCVLQIAVLGRVMYS